MSRRLLPNLPLALKPVVTSTCIILSLVAVRVRAEMPDRTPELRIEAGLHMARTLDAAVDAAGRVLVTASEDKTARVWSLPGLRALGVLRPPTGAGDVGKLNAVAVSPNGRLAAVGGWTRPGAHDVLLFDLRARQVVRRIAGLPDTIQSLAFSPDGARLAAGMAGSSGIRVWRLADAALLAEDRSYAGRVHGMAFAPDGRLAAASYDGAVRIYDAMGRQLRREATAAAHLPFQIRFSPDGRLLAIGFADAAVLEVRDGATLALHHRPDVTGLDGNALARVGWSADGATLFAGGSASGNGNRPVFAWAEAGAGSRRVAAMGFRESIVSVLPLADGRLALASLSGDIAVAGRNGANLAERHTGAGDLNRPTDDLSAASWRLRVSRTGAVVEWTFFGAPTRWLRFDAAMLAFTADELPQLGLRDWSDAAADLHLTDWNARTDPKLNGHPLALGRYERAYSAAVLPIRALLGSNWSLRLFDAEAHQLWRRPVPAPAWRVNLSPDGRLAVAAHGDGTIRWYRTSDGTELLALFVTPDARRWVAWTPFGYFAASAGGEELIGWHVNNGPDRAADFFSADRFRDTYHRPDVVTRVLATLDERRAVAVANARAIRGQRGRAGGADPGALRTALPPVLAILSPAEGETVPAGEARLSVRLRSPSGQPITRVLALVDGRLQPGAGIGPSRPLPPPAPGEIAEEREVRVDLTAAIGREAAVQILAATETREGEPATVRLHVAAATAAAAIPPRPLPRLNAVLVGVSAYRDRQLKLDYAAKDATDLAAALQRQQGVLYREVNLRVLSDSRVSRKAVNEALVWLGRETTDRDTAVVFLAGHGVTSSDGDFFFLPPMADKDRVEATGIPGDDLRRPLRRMAGRVLVFLDTCYAGALFAERTRGPANMNEVVNDLLAARRGLAVYTATTENTRAQERRELDNGVFTAALLRGLAGEADRYPADGVIRVTELADYLAEEVKRLTDGRQRATFGLPREGSPADPLFAPIR